MILDSSALIAILDDEPHGPGLLERLRAEVRLRMSAPAFVETAIVMDTRRRGVPPEQLSAFFTGLGIEVVAFDEGQAAVARDAYRRFGRGSGHPAQLNLGDCFSYALASTTREPLLFIGNDFTHTDVRDARARPS